MCQGEVYRFFNKARLEDYEKIRKTAIIEREFPERLRSVTAFQKIRVDRKEVEELYRKEIEWIYRSG